MSKNSTAKVGDVFVTVKAEAGRPQDSPGYAYGTEFFFILVESKNTAPFSPQEKEDAAVVTEGCAEDRTEEEEQPPVHLPAPKPTHEPTPEAGTVTASKNYHTGQKAILAFGTGDGEQHVHAVVFMDHGAGKLRWKVTGPVGDKWNHAHNKVACMGNSDLDGEGFHVVPAAVQGVSDAATSSVEGSVGGGGEWSLPRSAVIHHYPPTVLRTAVLTCSPPPPSPPRASTAL